LPLPALVPTNRFASPIWSNCTQLPGGVNRASYQLARLQLGRWARRGIDRWRAGEGLPHRSGRHDPLRGPGPSGTPVLHAFSPHVLDRPDDWPSSAHVCGYWFLRTPSDWTPPRKLAAFLDAGEPPVYLGFGSMHIADPHALASMVEKTATQLGVRVILAMGYHGRPLACSNHVLIIRHAPHDWLFPQVSMVVHHGGAGTTGAAAAAGCPQAICPVGTDQPFWAARMRAIGVAVEAPPLRSMTGPALQRAIRQVLDDTDLRKRAVELGRRVSAEDGPGRAVSLLEQIMSSPQRVEALRPCPC
jgi:sterol 3beta-glucosyltransferase